LKTGTSDLLNSVAGLTFHVNLTQQRQYALQAVVSLPKASYKAAKPCSRCSAKSPAAVRYARVERCHAQQVAHLWRIGHCFILNTSGIQTPKYITQCKFEQSLDYLRQE
jgi:hypothetical protein